MADNAWASFRIKTDTKKYNSSQLEKTKQGVFGYAVKINLKVCWRASIHSHQSVVAISKKIYN